ncbi:hypothetical protein [Rhizobium sp. L245/93]|uniref:hypothetical protein n=1 Tax=Rhizobium sp. L245/93 TaxID=2819998 RepID=UPI001ADB1870|nr:hypothetical protein [Rhizobium sp. L245/93]MBO9168414.1 hypothetical protein [Rhizobium sp. L245/93]
MNKFIALLAASALLASAGCTTPYNQMNEAQRFTSFQRQCSAVGHTGEMLNVCAADMERQFTQQRNRQVATGVALVALGAVAILVARNGGGGSAPAYKGNCQYDWQYDAAGNRCGHRSAFSQPGGY